jgi:diaminopimelate decarboxylase
LTGFYHDHFKLHVDGVPLAAVAETHGTPLYVYSADTIRQRYRDIDTAFAAAPHALHYALKANSTLAVVRLLRGLGAKADANSGGEIDVCLRAGFIPTEIVFTGVGKSRDELEKAIALGVKAINAESAGELARIDAIAQGLGARARVALRINPDIDALSHPHISTGLKTSKFGLGVSEARDVLRDAAARPGLEVVGIHIHVGSQITAIGPLARAAGELAEFARTLRADGIGLEHLDLGGGLGISYDGSQVPSAAEYAQSLMSATADLGLQLIVEPGRSVVGPAGALVTRVMDVKQRPDGRWLVVADAGMTELLRPAMYGAFHRILPVVQRPDTPVTCDVVGPVCESSDVLGVNRQLALPQEGDLLAVLDAGAYGAAMASNYNRRPLAAEVMVDAGRARLVRRRQTIEELLALDE